MSGGFDNVTTTIPITKVIKDFTTFSDQIKKRAECSGNNPPPTRSNCDLKDLTCCSPVVDNRTLEREKNKVSSYEPFTAMRGIEGFDYSNPDGSMLDQSISSGTDMVSESLNKAMDSAIKYGIAEQQPVSTPPVSTPPVSTPPVSPPPVSTQPVSKILSPQNILSEQENLNNAMSTNSKLMTDLTNFNYKYNKYMNCNGVNPPPFLNNCGLTDITCCSSSDTGNTALTSLTSLQGTLINDIQTMSNVNKDLKNSGYFSSIDKTILDYNKIVNIDISNNNIRDDLDRKLRELYKLDGSTINDKLSQYDSVMYVGILFTCLATTILFYTFKEL